jgi:hypothetical protein
MIGNPFLYRAADVRSGTMAEDRNFVNLFGISALGLIKEKMQGLWDIPLFLPTWVVTNNPWQPKWKN